MKIYSSETSGVDLYVVKYGSSIRIHLQKDQDPKSGSESGLKNTDPNSSFFCFNLHKKYKKTASDPDFVQIRIAIVGHVTFKSNFRYNINLYSKSNFR